MQLQRHKHAPAVLMYVQRLRTCLRNCICTIEFAGGIRCTEQSGLSMRCTSKKHSMRRSVLSLVASVTVFGVIENLDLNPYLARGRHGPVFPMSHSAPRLSRAARCVFSAHREPGRPP